MAHSSILRKMIKEECDKIGYDFILMERTA